MANEFTKQLSEPNVVSVPQVAQPTGSLGADIANLASTGLQALLMQEQKAQSALGLNFANNLLADVAQVESPSKRKMLVRQREAQFLDANRDNPLAMEAYFKTMKGRNFKTSVQQVQEARVVQERREEEARFRLVESGKTIVAGMSTDPQYQELLSKMGDRVTDETYISIAQQFEGRNQLTAQKKAELDYSSGQYSFDRKKSEDKRMDSEREAKNTIVAKSQTELTSITNQIRVPHTLLGVASSPQERIEASKVMANTLLKGGEELNRWVASLSPDERRLLDTDALFKEYDTRVKQYEAFTDPDKVNKMSDNTIKQAVLAFNANQFLEGSPNAQSVAMSVITGTPINDVALSQFQREARNGKVNFKIIGDAVSKVYDGNYSQVKETVSIFRDNVPDSQELPSLVGAIAVAASNPRNELHDPTTQRTVDKMLEKALETPEGTQQYTQSVEERGQDAVETTMKGFKNYVNGTLAPSLARLRSEGATGVSVELDSKGNIVLTPEAVQAENFANRNPVPNINLGGIAPSVPQQFNVTSARIAREVSTELNKHVDLLSKLMPDVPRATVAQMMLDGTKLAFRTQEQDVQPQEDNQ